MRNKAGIDTSLLVQTTNTQTQTHAQSQAPFRSSPMIRPESVTPNPNVTSSRLLGADAQPQELNPIGSYQGRQYFFSES